MAPRIDNIALKSKPAYKIEQMLLMNSYKFHVYFLPLSVVV
jgi:hypothetical protein